MAQDLIRISFPDASSAEAERLGLQLRDKLADSGIPSDGIAFKPASPENMAGGTIIQIAEWVMTLVTVGDATQKIAQKIMEFSSRKRCKIAIKSPIGEITIALDKKYDPQVSDVMERLSALLNELAKLHHGTSGQ